MGLDQNILEFMHKSFEAIRPTGFENKRILELGNQKLRKIPRKILRDKYNKKFSTAKKYLEFLGFQHYSIDINGKDGAIKIDLSEPFKDKFWINNFDIITNFGTIEHVISKKEPFYYGHWQVWENIHNAAKKGSIFIHSLPLNNSWAKHGYVKYDLEFIEKLAKTNKYEISLQKILKNIPKKELILICLIKKENIPFMEDKDQFLKWIHTEE